MYKLLTIQDMVRIPPKRFNEDLGDVIISELRDTVCGRAEKDLGIVLAVKNVKEVSEGKIILGDGAVYYDAKFEVLAYQPQLHEVVDGVVTEITEFGAFVNFGPIDGLIHVSQITEDYMGYDQKNNMFIGKDSKKTLKQGDVVRARVITISMKERAFNSKIGLTMRQPYLGKIEWLDAEKKEQEKALKEREKEPKKEGRESKEDKKKPGKKEGK